MIGVVFREIDKFAELSSFIIVTMVCWRVVLTVRLHDCMTVDILDMLDKLDSLEDMLQACHTQGGTASAG